MSTSRLGFTLIELSIVLVTIGLIVGGIFVGKDMIQAATIRKVISQKERFDTAANTFKAKYNCLPGDCPNASQFGLINLWSATPVGSGYTIDGNGDGKIGPNSVVTDEFTHFWYQLAGAGLLTDSIPTYGKAMHYAQEYLGLKHPRQPL